mgnify:CR=1 FL=1
MTFSGVPSVSPAVGAPSPAEAEWTLHLKGSVHAGAKAEVIPAGSATVGSGGVAGSVAGSLRAVIGLDSSQYTRNPAGPLGWRDSGSLRGEPCRLVLGASSIPPSKKNDEPKNREYEEHAEHAGACR